uniref:Uncharacterized protein n=1 Tax=Rhizophora mucronata TaxID=61149 RepID=A0A2P2P3G1_RHIMU
MTSLSLSHIALTN